MEKHESCYNFIATTVQFIFENINSIRKHSVRHLTQVSCIMKQKDLLSSLSGLS
jgi:hypothetical protein